MNLKNDLIQYSKLPKKKPKDLTKKLVENINTICYMDEFYSLNLHDISKIIFKVKKMNPIIAKQILSELNRIHGHKVSKLLYKIKIDTDEDELIDILKTITSIPIIQQAGKELENFKSRLEDASEGAISVDYEHMSHQLKNKLKLVREENERLKKYGSQKAMKQLFQYQITDPQAIIKSVKCGDELSVEKLLQFDPNLSLRTDLNGIPLIELTKDENIINLINKYTPLDDKRYPVAVSEVPEEECSTKMKRYEVESFCLLMRKSKKYGRNLSNIDIILKHGTKDHLVCILLTDSNPKNLVDSNPNVWKSVCENNDVDIVNYLCRIGANLNPSYDLSPLSLAAQNGCTDIIQILIKHGASANHLNPAGESPIHFAAKSNKIESLELLLLNGGEVDLNSDVGISPLIAAIKSKANEAALFLINKGATLSHGTLSCAVENGMDKVVELMLQKSKALDINMNADSSLLHVASRNGHTSVVSVLCAYGANVNAIGKDRKTPLMNSIMVRDIQMTKILLNSGAHVDVMAMKNITAIHLAVKENLPEVVELLCENKSQTSYKGEPFVPLIFAAKERYLDCAKVLIRYGADPNYVPDGRKKGVLYGPESSLEYAVDNKDIEMAKLICNKLSPDDMRTTTNSRAIYTAVYNLDTEMVKLLCEHGADTNVIIHLNIKFQTTPLLTALSTPGDKAIKKEIVKILLTHDADTQLSIGSNKKPYEFDLVVEVMSELTGIDMDLSESSTNSSCKATPAPVQKGKTPANVKKRNKRSFNKY